jgi:hypothetical protein
MGAIQQVHPSWNIVPLAEELQSMFVTEINPLIPFISIE